MAEFQPYWILSQIHIVVYILFYIRKNKTSAFQGNIIVIFLFTLQLCTTEISPTSVVTFHQLHRLWQFYKTLYYLFVFLFGIFSIAIAIVATIHPTCCSRMMRTVIFRILSAFFRFWLQPALLKLDSFISFNLFIFAPKWAQLWKSFFSQNIAEHCTSALIQPASKLPLLEYTKRVLITAANCERNTPDKILDSKFSQLVCNLVCNKLQG